jgi:hypothetical protein
MPTSIENSFNGTHDPREFCNKSNRISKKLGKENNQRKLTLRNKKTKEDSKL